MSIRVVLADDAADMREMLRFALERGGDITVVAEAVTADEALQSVREHRPDVVLLDLSLPGVEAERPVDALLAAAPECRVLILSGVDQPRQRERVLRAGAAEYLVKGARPRDIVDAVRRHGGAPCER